MVFPSGYSAVDGKLSGGRAVSPNSGVSAAAATKPQGSSNAPHLNAPHLNAPHLNAPPLQWGGFWGWYDQLAPRNAGNAGLLLVARAEKPAGKSDKSGAKDDKHSAKGEKHGAKGENPAAKTAEEPAGPTTYTVKKGPLRVTVSSTGSSRRRRRAKLSLSPRNGPTSTVESAVAARGMSPPRRRTPESGDRETRSRHRRLRADDGASRKLPCSRARSSCRR